MSCVHPLCTERTARTRLLCGRHFNSLPNGLKRAAQSHANMEQAARDQFVAKVTQHFRDNMLGEHDIIDCRVPGCSARIVFLPAFTRDGSEYRVAVDIDTVTADDADFNRRKHRKHRETCADPDYFSRRR